MGSQAGTLQQQPMLPPVAPLQQQQPQQQRLQQQLQQLHGVLYMMPGEHHSTASWQSMANNQQAVLPASHSSRQQGMSYQDQVQPSCGVVAAIHPLARLPLAASVGIVAELAIGFCQQLPG